MYEVYFEEKFVRISYESENNWIEVQWRSYQNLDQLQLGLNKILELMEKKSAQKVFMDMREIKGTFTEANEWMAKEWIPKANKLGFRYGVLTCSDDVFTKYATQDLLKKVGSSQIKIFCSIEEGKAWLAAQN